MPEVPDADGLLYQYGTREFSGEPRFHLDLTRQFAVPGEDAYMQFHCDVQLAPTGDLLSLGSHDEWWFRGAAGFEDWASGLRSRAEWSLLNKYEPVAVRLHLDKT